MRLFPTETVTPELLNYLGLTENDIVKGVRQASQTFDCFDSNGVYYREAFINTRGEVMDMNGNIIKGVELDKEAGTVTDAYGNVKNVTFNNDTVEQVADNPDIAPPPQNVNDGTDEGTVWAGVTDEDLQDSEE